jgi:protein-tyrosine phosphatase
MAELGQARRRGEKRVQPRSSWPSPNVPALEGAFNFRDLGGLPTDDGGSTVFGSVFRSDALEHLTSEDVRVLRDRLGIQMVIDLRAHIETDGRSPGWATGEGIEVVSLPLSDAWEGWGTLTDETRRTLLARKYLSYIEVAGANLVAALERIAANAGHRPTIIHCAVGKDRTGVLAAILLSLIGVQRDAIVADYLQTAGNMHRIMERLAASEIYRERVRTNPPEVYRAEAHTIRLFLAELDSLYGGAAGWARASGLTEGAFVRLRKALVEHEGEGGKKNE